MYEFIPQKTNQTARKLILLFFAGAAALFALTLLVPAIPFRWVFQLFALALLTAAIFLVTRYVTKLYIYRTEPTAGGAVDLTVTEAAANGKRAVTVCRIGLSQIRHRRLVSSQTEFDAALKELKKERIRLYDYTVDLHPTESILLLAEEGGETLALRLAYDQTLFELLTPTESDPSDTAEGEDA
ncbi:MAG: hypothetical protein E7668_01695 [Ruminococcaceae bacterium]|nr:hypothetical protein [Oscillospiraceae bacterium]